MKTPLLKWEPLAGGQFIMGTGARVAILTTRGASLVYTLSLLDGAKKTVLDGLCGATARKRASQHCMKGRK